LRYRALALLPLMLVVIMAATALALGDRMPLALTIANETGKMLALTGGVTAALAFERGEYLNRAWFTYSGCYLLLLVNDALGVAGLTSPQMMVLRGLVVIAAHGCSVGGTFMLARAWTVAGLDDDDGRIRARRRMMFAGTGLLALLITGWPLAEDVRGLVAGHPVALISIASDLGDAFTLALIAPVMQTALAMRGGLLRWPWGLLTMSHVSWLVYDATSDLLILQHAGPGLALVASEAVRVLANGWIFAAGISQRLAVAPDARVSQLPKEWL
jgi:hypothetical protein